MTVRTTHLGKVVDVSAGQPAPKPNDFSKHGYPFIRAGSLEGLLSGQTEDDCEKIDAETARQYRMRLYPKDTILFPKSGMSAKIGRVYRTRQSAYVVSHLAALAPTGKYDPSYLSHWLRAHPPSTLIKDDAYPSIRTSEVASLEVPDLHPDEQRRIAAILDKADAIRRKREQALTLADNFLRSVFLEMFGDPGDNPMNHPVETFGSLLSIPLRNGISPASRGTVTARVLTLTAITGDRFDGSYAKEGKFLEPISVKDTVSTSDFYICRGNGSPDLIGKGFYADQNIPGTAFPDTMIAAKPNPKRVTRAFLESTWNGPFVRNQIREAARTTNGTFKINQTAAGGIKIPVPPLEAQKRFQTIVDRVARSKEKLAYGGDLFPALSQRAFAGDL